MITKRLIAAVLVFVSATALGDEWGWARVDMFGMRPGDDSPGPFVMLTHTRPDRTSFPFEREFFRFAGHDFEEQSKLIPLLESALVNGLEVHFLANYDAQVPGALPIIKVIYLTGSRISSGADDDKGPENGHRQDDEHRQDGEHRPDHD